MKSAAESWLRPSLLERLTDHHPERALDRPDAQQIDDAELRRLLQRDLTWLFNTTHLKSTRDLSDYPEVGRSVLNFGIPDLAGRSANAVRSEAFSQQIREALWNYESRLIRDSLRVEVKFETSRSGKPVVLIEIAAVLRLEPLPLAIRVCAEVDLESGHVVVAEEPADRQED